MNRTISTIAAVALACATPSTAWADEFYLYATTVTDTSNDWCLDTKALGSPANSDCNSGGWCTTMDYAGNDGGNGFLTATQLDSFSLPAGQGICDVRFNVYVRYDIGATGVCRVRVTLPGFGSKDFLSDSMSSNAQGDCHWAFSAPANQITPATFGASGPWTAALVNSLTVGVRRESVTPTSSNFRCKALRIYVATGPDSDGDGWADCIDACPTDPAKQASPGTCGCGHPDSFSTYYADQDGDGFGDPSQPLSQCSYLPPPPGYVANSGDLCPSDPNKHAPGTCGCGHPDTLVTYYADLDHDGCGDPNQPLTQCSYLPAPPNYVTNSADLCPNDPAKCSPGTCGCGHPDTLVTYYADLDHDGCGDPSQSLTQCSYLPPPANYVPSSGDLCPNDPTKCSPGACGCGHPDTDTDSDGTPDCIDGCPNDPLKVAAGTCGCGHPDTLVTYYSDLDHDGAGDPGQSVTQCSYLPPPPNYVTNANDQCPSDPLKSTPGACGCGNPETDTDGDGTPDCIDGCPSDPAKVAPGACGCGSLDTDSDGDGVADCIDLCPTDPNKSTPGACGCGHLETDTDGDTVPDCVDQCPGKDDTLDCNQNGVPDCIEVGFPGTDINHDGIPDDCQCLGDLNGDGKVAGDDLGVILGDWGQCASGLVDDLNADGCVNAFDLAILLGNWGPCGS